ncbi:MAG: helix-turn-helix transcriptional regulator [Erysipelotrichaceae bacterium]|nr:helix-turn-helix transcriptional regulator [Erysipelotrichaceae bacterium]
MNGNKLKKLRENQGLLQKELADKIGISLSSISMYERGERQPDNDTLKKLSQYFNVSIDYLLDNEISATNLKDNELKEIETLKKALQKVGFMNGNEDLTDEELDNAMKFLVNNKEFLKGSK